MPGARVGGNGTLKLQRSSVGVASGFFDLMSTSSFFSTALPALSSFASCKSAR